MGNENNNNNGNKQGYKKKRYYNNYNKNKKKGNKPSRTELVDEAQRDDLIAVNAEAHNADAAVNVGVTDAAVEGAETQSAITPPAPTLSQKNNSGQSARNNGRDNQRRNQNDRRGNPDAPRRQNGTEGNSNGGQAKPPIPGRNKILYEQPTCSIAPGDGLIRTSTEAENAGLPMVEVVGIRFRKGGKVYYFDPSEGSIVLSKGEFAIVETARGLEFGEVWIANRKVSEKEIVPPLRPVIRKATEADIAHNADNRAREVEAFRICMDKIAVHGLDMKLVESQYTFDNTKLQFYFTSAGRVDFRELVKDLASVFRTRIELRQIGIRDEAKLMGGLGICGRPLCCASFLSDFVQVSIKMAKEQGLSLNSAKISGICGRLMCCLNYEYSTYEEEIKKLPPIDSLVKTPDGPGYVTEMNPLAGTVRVRLNSTPDVMPKTYSNSVIEVLERAKVVVTDDRNNRR